MQCADMAIADLNLTKIGRLFAQLSGRIRQAITFWPDASSVVMVNLGGHDARLFARPCRDGFTTHAAPVSSQEALSLGCPAECA